MVAGELQLLALGLLAAGLLPGWLLATLLRRQDDHTFALARAPALPIRALAVGDDAWLRGRVRSGTPLICPWFDVPCVAFSYAVERKVTVTRRDSKGRTSTETTWRTERSERRAVDFELDDGAAIAIDMEHADNEALRMLGTDYETGSRRHSASVLEIGAEVSVLGVLRDDRTFGTAARVPCLITRLEPGQRVARAHQRETLLFAGALLLPFAGGAGAVVVLLQARDPAAWLWALSAGALLVLPLWWLLTHNRLIRLSQQVATACRQVDVDLAVRAALVPNLLEVVRQAAAHEQDLLQAIAHIRAGADRDERIGHDDDDRRATRRVLTLHERHPELRSDGFYRDLHDRLWAIEEKLAHTRSFYNAVVTEWNDRISRFPSVLVARARGYAPAALFADLDVDLPPRLS